MVTEQRAMIDTLTDYIQLLTTTNLHSGPTNSNFMTKSKQATSKMSVERESPIQVEFTSVHFTMLLNRIELYSETPQACVNELVVQAIQFANNMIRDTFTALKKAVEVKRDFKLGVNAKLPHSVTRSQDSIRMIQEELGFQKKTTRAFEEAMASLKEMGLASPIGINTDIKRPGLFQFLKQVSLQTRKRLFDLVMIDYPWTLSISRKKMSAEDEAQDFIKYSMLKDKDLSYLALNEVQTQGFIFMWVINTKTEVGIDFLKQQGYR